MEKIQKNSAIQHQECLTLNGRIKSRVILHLVEKSKLGFEELEFASLQLIQKNSDEELAKVSPGVVATPAVAKVTTSSVGERCIVDRQ